MNKVQELKNKIKDIDGALNSPATPDGFKDGLRAKKTQFEAELKALESAPKPPEKKQAPKPAPVKKAAKKSALVKLKEKVAKPAAKPKPADKPKPAMPPKPATPPKPVVKPTPKSAPKPAPKQASAPKKSALERLSAKAKSFNKGRSKASLKADAGIKAKKAGRRVSASGNVYYEYRPNRADISRQKPYLEKGGMLENQNYIVVIPYEETARLFHASKTIHQESYLGENDSIVYFESQAKRFEKQIAEDIANNWSQAKAYGKKPYARKINEAYLQSGGLLSQPIEVVDVISEGQQGLIGIIDQVVPVVKFEDGGVTGENINVYGYQTQNFNICPTAVKEFKAAVQHFEAFPDLQLEQDALQKEAEHVDVILGVYKQAKEESAVSRQDYAKAINALIAASMNNYRSGMLVNLFNFIPEKMTTIAAAMVDYAFEKGGMIDLPIQEEMFEKGGTIESHQKSVMKLLYEPLREVLRENGLNLREDYVIGDGSDYLMHPDIYNGYENEDGVKHLTDILLDYTRGGKSLGSITIIRASAKNWRVEIDFPIFNLKETVNNIKYADGGMLETNRGKSDYHFAQARKYYHLQDYQMQDEELRKAYKYQLKALAENKAEFDAIYNHPDVTVIIVGGENKPLSTQLTDITGDSYNAIDYEGNAGVGEIITHKATGKKFTVLNDSQKQIVEELRKKKFEKGGALNAADEVKMQNYLNQKIRFEGNVVTVKEMIDSLIKQGYYLSETKEVDKSASKKLNEEWEYLKREAPANENHPMAKRLKELSKMPKSPNDKNEIRIYKSIPVFRSKDGKSSYDASKFEVKYFEEKTKMKKGGTTEEGVNLFEDYENIPPKVQAILDKYPDVFQEEEGDYRRLEQAKKELEKIGYTFDYYLDGMPVDLRKIGQKGKIGGDDEYEQGGLVPLSAEYKKRTEAEIKSTEKLIEKEKGKSTLNTDYIKFLESHIVKLKKMLTDGWNPSGYEKGGILPEWKEGNDTQIIMVDGHTLAARYKERPNQAEVIGRSILKGSPHRDLDIFSIYPRHKEVRLATLKDFDDMRVSEKGFVQDKSFDFIRK